MIFVVYAPPRTGKSLYAVYKINRLDPEKHYIITNIEGYQPPNPELDVEYWQDAKVQENITATDWEEKSARIGKKIILALDEAQRFYPSTGMPRGMTNELLYFLEYHGHYGMDIYLISQSNMSLHIRTKPLVSELVQISKIKSLSGEWRYRKKDPITYELIEKGTFKPEQSDFDSYKSAHTDEGLQTNQTPMARLKKLIALSLLAFVTGAIVLYWVVSDWIGVDEVKAEEKKHDPQPVLSQQPKEKPQPPKPSFSLASPELYLTYSNYLVNQDGFTVNINGIKIDTATAHHFQILNLQLLETQNLLVTYLDGRTEIVLPKPSTSRSGFEDRNGSNRNNESAFTLPSVNSVLGR